MLTHGHYPCKITKILLHSVSQNVRCVWMWLTQSYAYPESRYTNWIFIWLQNWLLEDLVCFFYSSDMLYNQVTNNLVTVSIQLRQKCKRKGLKQTSFHRATRILACYFECPVIISTLQYLYTFNVIKKIINIVFKNSKCRVLTTLKIGTILRWNKTLCTCREF